MFFNKTSILADHMAGKGTVVKQDTYYAAVCTVALGGGGKFEIQFIKVRKGIEGVLE